MHTCTKVIHFQRLPFFSLLERENNEKSDNFVDFVKVNNIITHSTLLRPKEKLHMGNVRLVTNLYLHRKTKRHSQQNQCMFND